MNISKDGFQEVYFSKGLTPNQIRNSSRKRKKSFECIMFYIILYDFMTGTSTGSERLAGLGFDCPLNLLKDLNLSETARWESFVAALPEGGHHTDATAGVNSDGAKNVGPRAARPPWGPTAAPQADSFPQSRFFPTEECDVLDVKIHSKYQKYHPKTGKW